MRQELYAPPPPPFIRPPALEGYLQGGGVGVYKIRPRIFFSGFGPEGLSDAVDGQRHCKTRLILPLTLTF